MDFEFSIFKLWIDECKPIMKKYKILGSYAKYLSNISATNDERKRNVEVERIATWFAKNPRAADEKIIDDWYFDSSKGPIYFKNVIDLGDRDVEEKFWRNLVAVKQVLKPELISAAAAAQQQQLVAAGATTEDDVDIFEEIMSCFQENQSNLSLDKICLKALQMRKRMEKKPREAELNCLKTLCRKASRYLKANNCQFEGIAGADSLINCVEKIGNAKSENELADSSRQIIEGVADLAKNMGFVDENILSLFSTDKLLTIGTDLFTSEKAEEMVAGITNMTQYLGYSLPFSKPCCGEGTVEKKGEEDDIYREAAEALNEAVKEIEDEKEKEKISERSDSSSSNNAVTTLTHATDCHCGCKYIGIINEVYDKNVDSKENLKAIAKAIIIDNNKKH